MQDDTKNTRNFFGSRPRRIRDYQTGELSLNKAVRNKEYMRIMQENEAMLKRLQARQSTYNVTGWQKDRKEQIKLVKKICHYKPSITRRRKIFSKKLPEHKLDMEKRYASAGPNKQMYEIYNMSIKQSLPIYDQSNNFTGGQSLNSMSHAKNTSLSQIESKANMIANVASSDSNLNQGAEVSAQASGTPL